MLTLWLTEFQHSRSSLVWVFTVCLSLLSSNKFSSFEASSDPGKNLPLNLVLLLYPVPTRPWTRPGYIYRCIVRIKVNIIIYFNCSGKQPIDLNKKIFQKMPGTGVSLLQRPCQLLKPYFKVSTMLGMCLAWRLAIKNGVSWLSHASHGGYLLSGL